MGLEASPNMVEFEGRIVKLIVVPPGIELEQYANKFFHHSHGNNTESQEQEITKVKAVETTSTTDTTGINDIKNETDSEQTKTKLGDKFNERLAELKKEFEGKKVVVAYDKLSRVSGIIQTVTAFSRYLKQNSNEWKQKKIVWYK